MSSDDEDDAEAFGGGGGVRGDHDYEYPGPFSNLTDLLKHQAHLAVFLNFVISNMSAADPAALLFHLISDAYRGGSVKEMQRWAFEIHSSFLVPQAPLLLRNLDESAMNETEGALLEDFEKEDAMRQLFFRARKTAWDRMEAQLADFRDKRAAGLGFMYGPGEAELRACETNKARDARVAEDLLVPVLRSLAEDLDNATDRTLTIAAAVATLMAAPSVVAAGGFDCSGADAKSLVEKCPLFVAKTIKKTPSFGLKPESKKPRWLGEKKSGKAGGSTRQVQGHSFELKHFVSYTLCNQSGEMIWGIGPQGYRCANCGFNVYRKYVHRVEETCVGPPSANAASGGAAAATASTCAALNASLSFPSLASSLNVSLAAFEWDDSDMETEATAPDWRQEMAAERLAALGADEKKRQDVVNELFHTERSHVRNLKVLDRIFFRPLRDADHVAKDLLFCLFPNLEEILQVHDGYNQKMKERRKQGFPIGDIGSLLCDMFGGESGAALQREAGNFTQHQKFAIEELKEQRRRDTKLDAFLAEQERRPECRRLQLQSLLPAEHQRLVKYPLLLESLAKQSAEEEAETIRQCIPHVRTIIEAVDRSVAEAEDRYRMLLIQRNLDTSGLERMADNPAWAAICADFRAPDLIGRRLIHDGPLTMKFNDGRRMKTVDLHVILFEDCIMLLQKTDDKYLLKFHTTSGLPGGAEPRPSSPVIVSSSMMVRHVATDERSFYLINSEKQEPQIYELEAPSTADRAKWFRHITEASKAFNPLAARSQSFYDHYRLPAMPLGLPAAYADVSAASAAVVGGDAPSSAPESAEAKLRRADADVTRALEEKQRLIAEMLHIPHGAAAAAPDDGADEGGGADAGGEDATRVLLAAMEQAQSLSDLVNERLTLADAAPSSSSVAADVSESDGRVTTTRDDVRGVTTTLRGPLPDRLFTITTAMNRHLSSLMVLLQARDAERQRLRRDLRRSRDRIRALQGSASPPSGGSDAANADESPGYASPVNVLSDATPPPQPQPPVYATVHKSYSRSTTVDVADDFVDSQSAAASAAAAGLSQSEDPVSSAAASVDDVKAEVVGGGTGTGSDAKAEVIEAEVEENGDDDTDSDDSIWSEPVEI